MRTCSICGHTVEALEVANDHCSWCGSPLGVMAAMRVGALQPPPAWPQAIVPAVQPAAEADARSLRATLHAFWLAFWCFAIGLSITLSWDGEYHKTRVFDTAFSPPHVFGYGTAFVCALISARLAFTPHMRRWFGAGVRVWPVRFPVPGVLFILGAGFVLLGMAGALDLTWHSLFGLDETNWSLPHSMIGCALCLIFLGFLASRIALARHRPITAVGLGTVLLAALTLCLGIGLGPLFGNLSPETVYHASINPIVLREPSAQHTYRIYEAWDLNRTNPIFVPLAALWLGAVLALAQGITARRWGVYLVVIALWSLLLVTPGPIWLAILATALLPRLRVNQRWARLVAGALFGLAGAYVWDNPTLALPMALLAAPLFMWGSHLGTQLAAILHKPGVRGNHWFVLLGISIPMFTGAIDLLLRTHTP